MRKFLLFSVLCGLMVNPVLGANNCVLGAGVCVTNDDCITVAELGSFYQCDKAACNSGSTVTTTSHVQLRGGKQYPNGGIFTCYLGDNDHWDLPANNNGAIAVCPETQVPANTENAVPVLTTKAKASTVTYKDRNTTALVGWGCFSWVCKDGFFTQGDACVKDNRPTVCSNGGGTWSGGKCSCGSKIWNEPERKCVENTERNACMSSGGTWDETNATCTCDSAKELKPADNSNKKCVCVHSGYNWDGANCVNKSGRTRAGQNQVNRDVARQNENNKNTCEGSGGAWDNKTKKCICDDAKNMKLSGGKCTCIPEYVWNNDADKSLGCKMGDEKALQTACNAAPQGTTKWNLSSKRCDCVNSNQTFNGTECKDNEDYAECKPLVASGVATWDAKREQKCMCNRQGYIIENGKCVESQDAKDKRLAKEAEDKLKASRRKIEDAHANLTRMVDGFKVSVWKDEEGKFNTARLASDAIAGVVLGTVGGVVTSSVVKKNQVENGFEDLKCTIGGQVVAEWGDEFRVGIQ